MSGPKGDLPPAQSEPVEQKPVEEVKEDVDVKVEEQVPVDNEPAKKKKKLSINDFEKIKLIGRGAFGEVLVVRKKDSGEIFAMKIMRKVDMIKKNQVKHIRAERDLLAAADNHWVVRLLF